MKSIVFDLGGVILKGNPISILDTLNVDEKTYKVLKMFFLDWKKLDLGEENLEDKYKQCNFPKEYDGLYKNILINYYKYRMIDKRLIELINNLKKNGYNIYILSDNNKECFEYYKIHPDSKNIDGWILSCDYHTLKRDSQLFDIFIRSFNLNPSECYYIDDKQNNIEIAKKHGINGIMFNTKEDINNLYDDMRDNSINI